MKSPYPACRFHPAIRAGRIPATIAALLFAAACASTATDPAARTGTEAVPVLAHPVAARRVRVAVLGDTHSTSGVHARIVKEVIAERPALVLHTGDLALRAGKGETDAEGRFFRVEDPLLRSVPFHPVLGNHDGIGSRFVDLFVRPQGAGEEAYYVVRQGPLAIVALDTNQPLGAGSPQELWLVKTLESLAADSAVAFRIVAMHWGPYGSGSGHGSNLEAREALVPLFERWGVDVVFSGHDHVYERSTVRGVRYVVTGGGGGGRAKPHEVLGSAVTEAASTAPHHVLLEVDENELHLEARETGGKVLDAFRIAKRRPGLAEARPDR